MNNTITYFHYNHIHRSLPGINKYISRQGLSPDALVNQMIACSRSLCSIKKKPLPKWHSAFSITANARGRLVKNKLPCKSVRPPPQTLRIEQRLHRHPPLWPWQKLRRRKKKQQQPNCRLTNTLIIHPFCRLQRQPSVSSDLSTPTPSHRRADSVPWATRSLGRMANMFCTHDVAVMR